MQRQRVDEGITTGKQPLMLSQAAGRQPLQWHKSKGRYNRRWQCRSTPETQSSGHTPRRRAGDRAKAVHVPTSIMQSYTWYPSGPSSQACAGRRYVSLYWTTRSHSTRLWQTAVDDLIKVVYLHLVA